MKNNKVNIIKQYVERTYTKSIYVNYREKRGKAGKATVNICHIYIYIRLAISPIPRNPVNSCSIPEKQRGGGARLHFPANGSKLKVRWRDCRRRRGYREGDPVISNDSYRVHKLNPIDRGLPGHCCCWRGLYKNELLSTGRGLFLWERKIKKNKKSYKSSRERRRRRRGARLNLPRGVSDFWGSAVIDDDIGCWDRVDDEDDERTARWSEEKRRKQHETTFKWKLLIAILVSVEETFFFLHFWKKIQKLFLMIIKNYIL